MDSLCEAASLNQGSIHRPALPLPHPGLAGSPRGRTGAGTQSFCPLPRPLIAGDRTGWGKEGGHYRLNGHAATRTAAPPILPSKGGGSWTPMLTGHERPQRDLGKQNQQSTLRIIHMPQEHKTSGTHSFQFKKY